MQNTVIVQLNDMKVDHNQRIYHEQTVDDASTKESLYRMYAQLGEVLFNEECRGRCGPFSGTFDDLFTLRNRVIRRIALFDACGAAIHEAKSADVDI